jgi:hypothetical protein
MTDRKIAPTTSAAKRPLLRWAWHGLAGLLGLGLAAAAPMAPAQPAAPQLQVPQHWISYAQLVSNQFQARLSDPADDTVVRLHGWMQERMLQQDQTAPPPPLIVRVWVAASGKVERVEFASLGNAQADADLRTLLTAQPVTEPPPKDMRQPMVLQLKLMIVEGATSST